MLDFIQSNANTITYAAFFIFLLVCSYTDLRKREIPIVLCIPVVLLISGIRILSRTGSWEYIVVGIALGLLYLCQALLFTGSGGDVFLMLTVGYAMGLTGSLCAIIFSVVPMLIFAIIYKILHRKELFRNITYPLAPCITFGCIITKILQWEGILSIDLWSICTNTRF